MDDYSDWEAELSRPDSFPLSVSLAGSVILIALGIFVQPLFGYPPFGLVVGAGIGIAVLLWGIGYLITLRHARIGWKLGSLGILVAVALLSTIFSAAAGTLRLAADYATLSEVHVEPDGTATLPPGAAERGPVSRLYATYLKTIADDVHQVDTEFARAGLNALSDPLTLERYPALLKDCGTVTGVRKMALDMLDRRKRLYLKMARNLEAITGPEYFKQGVRNAVVHSDTPSRLDRLRGLAADAYDNLQGECQVLARRHWTPQYGRFMFSDARDLAEFNGHATRQQATAAAIRQLQSEEIERMQRLRDR